MSIGVQDGVGLFPGGVMVPSPGPVNPSGARKVRNPDIEEEYLASGFLGYGNAEHALGHLSDDLQRMRGPRVYETIAQDAKVGSAMSVLPQAALQEGITYTKPERHKLKPNETDDPEEADASQAEADAAVENGQPKKLPRKRLIDSARKQQIDDAQWALDFVKYNHNRAEFYDRSIEEWLYEMILEALTHGSEIAERVYEYQREGEGPYPNMAVHGRLKTKTRGIWAFVVDPYYDLMGILGMTDNPGEAILLPVDKFCIFTWNPAHSDPRGRSHLRTVWQAYFHKIQTWAEWFKFMQQCSSARTVGIMPEDEDSIAEGTASGGVTDAYATDAEVAPTNAPLSMARKFRKNLEIFHNGRAIVIPYGAEIKILPPAGNGEAFYKSIETSNNEIATAIHNNPQITTETKFGGKASTGDAVDLGYLLFCHIAHCASKLLRRYWFDLLAYNKGQAFAEEYTPDVTLIDSKNLDFSATAEAVSKLFQVNFFVEKHLPELDKRFGLPERNPDDKAAGPPSPLTTSPFGPGSGRQVPAPKPEPQPTPGESNS